MSDDFVLVVLEDVFTTAERTLVAAGRADEVKQARDAFNEIMRDQFVDAIESATGRRVRAFMCETHVDPEMAVEVFILEPDGA